MRGEEDELFVSDVGIAPRLSPEQYGEIYAKIKTHDELDAWALAWFSDAQPALEVIRAELEVAHRFLPREAVEQLPRGVAEIEERPAVLGDEEPSALTHAQPGQRAPRRALRASRMRGARSIAITKSPSTSAVMTVAASPTAICRNETARRFSPNAHAIASNANTPAAMPTAVRLICRCPV